MLVIDFSPDLLLGKPLERERVYLCQISPQDYKWDFKKAETDKVANLYKGTTYSDYTLRMLECGSVLEFVYATDSQTGERTLRLKSSNFCRCPRCPTCQWRRSLMWKGKAFNSFPKLIQDYPTARFLFLTLTVPNCPLGELRQTLAWMNKSWERLSKRKAFPAIGWVKAVEVTRRPNDYAHPHFHCLLMVKPGYFGRNYLNQEDWTELWRKSLRVDYTPIVDIRIVKSPSQEKNGMLEPILEVFKYAVKPQDLLKNSDVLNSELDRRWLVELTTQLYKTKSIATGGLLKEYLKDLESEPEDLIYADELSDGEIDKESPSLVFTWSKSEKHFTLE